MTKKCGLKTLWMPLSFSDSKKSVRILVWSFQILVADSRILVSGLPFLVAGFRILLSGLPIFVSGFRNSFSEPLKRKPMLINFRPIKGARRPIAT